MRLVVLGEVLRIVFVAGDFAAAFFAAGFAVARLIGFFVAAAFFSADFFGAAFFATRFAAGFLAIFFLAVLREAALTAARRVTVGRLTEPLAPLAVLVADRLTGRLPALRLAMMESFPNLDSFAISVVTSVAYRTSASPRVQAFIPASCSCYRTCGPPDPATKRR